MRLSGAVLTVVALALSAVAGYHVGQARDEVPSISLDPAVHAELIERVTEQYPDARNPGRWLPWWGSQVCLAASEVYDPEDTVDWMIERPPGWHDDPGFAELMVPASLEILCPEVVWP